MREGLRLPWPWTRRVMPGVGMTLRGMEVLAWRRTAPGWSVAMVVSGWRYYPGQGLAIRVIDGKVVEIILVEREMQR